MQVKIPVNIASWKFWKCFHWTKNEQERWRIFRESLNRNIKLEWIRQSRVRSLSVHLQLKLNCRNSLKEQSDEFLKSDRGTGILHINFMSVAGIKNKECLYKYFVQFYPRPKVNLESEWYNILISKQSVTIPLLTVVGGGYGVSQK